MRNFSGLVAVFAACGALAACPEAPAPANNEASSDAPPAYVGTWAGDQAQCQVPQEEMDAPLIMAVDRSDQHEAHCEFETVEQTGPNSWSIEASCSVEGDAMPAYWNIAVDGDTMTIAPDNTYVRCP